MYVSPKTDCPHIKYNSFLPIDEFKKISFENLKCECCSEANEIWVCITCGKSYCGRYINNHYYNNHYLKDKSHSICISMLDLSVWCYQCMTSGFEDPGSYIESPISSEYVKTISDFKFGDSTTIKKSDINSSLGISKEQSLKIKYDNFIELLKNYKFKNVTFLVGPEININKESNNNYKKFIFDKTKEKYKQEFEKINLENLFSKELFLSNPNLLYLYLKEFYLNEKEHNTPNISHYFIRYLIEKNLGFFVFSENFDGNEIKSGLLRKNIVFAKGNLLEGHCAKCNKKIDIKIINKGIEDGKIVKCDKCEGPCKPKVNLDGEEIDKEFYIQSDNILHCDLVFIIGTDLLSVPFSEIKEMININNPWIVVINQKEIGNYKFYDFSSKELFIEGKCDEIAKKIINDCGWNKDISNKFKINLN